MVQKWYFVRFTTFLPPFPQNCSKSFGESADEGNQLAIKSSTGAFFQKCAPNGFTFGARVQIPFKLCKIKEHSIGYVLLFGADEGI